MREIKFRAFGEKDKRMHYWRLNDSQSAWILPDQKISDIMQFTGHTDKNGKEIWEGDIVSSGEWIDGVIKWWDDNAQFIIADKEGYASDSDYAYEPIEWGENLEVIGNIWDNPELMKEDNNE